MGVLTGSIRYLAQSLSIYQQKPHLLHGNFSQTIIQKEATMLWTIFVILLVLWALGLLTGTTMGGVIHALLVIAIVVLVIQVLQGRRRM
jgi:hypothetical protein